MRDAFLRLGLAIALAIALVAGARPARARDASRPLVDYVHKRWGVPDGLPEGSPTAIVQTADGYIWFGTQNGLVRFDGLKFVTLDAHSTPLFGVSSWVTALAVDAEAAIWIGTASGGLLRYHHGNFSGFTVKDGLSSNRVNTLAAAPDGTLWVGTGGGLDVIRAGRVVDFPAKRAFARLDISATFAEADGSLWVGVAKEGLKLVRGEHVQSFGPADGVPSPAIFSLVRDRDGVLWAGSGNVVLRREAERFVRVPGAERAEGQIVRTLYVDRDNAVWVGWSGAGISVIRGGSMRKEKLPSGLATQEIVSILEDREGNLWLAGANDGLHFLREGVFQVINPTDKRLILRSVLEARDGSLWLGSLDHDLIRIRDGNATIFGEREGLPKGEIYALHEDEVGTLWVGAGNSVAKWTGEKFVEVPGAKVPGSELTVGIQGRSDLYWIGTYGGGLVQNAHGERRVFTTADGLPSDKVVSLYQAHDGALWIGTMVGARSGLARLADGQIKALTVEDGPPNATGYDYYEDPPGTIWIVTLSGVVRHKDGAFTTFSPEAGFPSEAHMIMADDLGYFWFASNKGICRVPREAFERYAAGQPVVPHIQYFDESDGLRDRETNTGGRSIVKLRDGRIGFATIDGLAVVDPRKVGEDQVEPPLVIEHFEVDGVSLPLDHPQIIAAGARHLHIEYAALTYVAPKRVRYRHMLEGYDRDWVNDEDARSAHYTNLPPGEYRFLVAAETGNGVWGKTSATLAFRQQAHFYQTVSFYILVALFVAAGATGVYRLRVRQLKAVAAVLEQRVGERTTELQSALLRLEQAHDKLATAHDQLASAHVNLTQAHKDLADKDARLQSDLLQARSFQRAMLPNLPRSPAIQFGALYEPAELVGGDIYDIAEVRPGMFRIFLADTTGHGVQSSLRTMVIKTEYDRLKFSCATPAQLLSELNARLVDHAERGVGGSACCIDVHTNGSGGAKVSYSNAAHPALLQVGRSQATVYAPSMYLGFTLDIEFPLVETVLAPGEVLLAYTDGAIEQEDAGGAMFGIERLGAALAETVHAGLSADAAVASIWSTISRFSSNGAGPPALADDVALVLIRAPA